MKARRKERKEEREEGEKKREHVNNDNINNCIWIWQRGLFTCTHKHTYTYSAAFPFHSSLSPCAQ